MPEGWNANDIPDVNKSRMFFGSFLSGDPPSRLDAHEGDLYLLSALSFCESGGDFEACFVVTFDDGKQCSSESFRISQETQDRMVKELKEARNSGAEAEVVDSSKNYGIMQTYELPQATSVPEKRKSSRGGRRNRK